MHYLDAYVPEDLFSEDHFRVLLHIHKVCTELNDGFEVGLDPCMRCNSRHFDVLSKRASKPKRPEPHLPYPKGRLKPVTTILRDGTKVQDGDDWSCLHDMAEVGYFDRSIDGHIASADAIHIIPGRVIYLSSRGQAIVDALLKMIAENGHYGGFAPSSIGSDMKEF